jgi:hypothetical protein
VIVRWCLRAAAASKSKQDRSCVSNVFLMCAWAEAKRAAAASKSKQDRSCVSNVFLMCAWAEAKRAAAASKSKQDHMQGFIDRFRSNAGTVVKYCSV